MTRSDPFSGLKLSDQVPPSGSGVDQRLFSTPPPPPGPRPGLPAPTENQETRKLGNQEPGKVAGREAGKEPSFPGRREVGRPFDIDDRPSIKHSYLVTEEEHEALEDLKLDLRRRFDLKASKNDIVRSAAHHVIEDFRRDAEASIVLRRLRKRRAR